MRHVSSDWRWADDYEASFSHTVWQCRRCGFRVRVTGADQTPPRVVRDKPSCGERIVQEVLES